MNKLYVMVGIPGSGKSVIAKTIADQENAIIIASDTIREELGLNNEYNPKNNAKVFKEFHKRIRKSIKMGNNVIADATNILIKSRKSYFKYLKDIKCEKIAYIISKPVELCIKENMGYDKSLVKESTILRQSKQFEIPSYEEGFDKIIVHNPN